VILDYRTNEKVTTETTKEQANLQSAGPWQPKTKQWVKEDIYELLTTECIVWATMNGTRRTNQAIETITALTIDFDEPPSEGLKPYDHMRQVRATVDRLKINYAMKPTNSHQKDKKGITCDRFRVVIPLKTAMPVSEMHRIKQWALGLFPDSDSSAFVVSRYWFRCPDDEIFMFCDGRDFLDWTTLPGEVKLVRCTTQVKNLPAAHRVSLESGEMVTLGELLNRGQKVKIRCPNVEHEDRNPSAFAALTSAGRLYISCSVCEDELRTNTNTRSWWLESGNEASVIDEWNLRHAKILHGGKDLVIIEEHDGDFSMVAAASFHNHNSDETIEVLSAGSVKRLPATKIWYTHPQARKYNRLVVKPANTYLRKGEYNAWRGYGVPRIVDSATSIEPLLDHIYTVICSSNQKHYEWLMAWIAQMYQDPTEKPGTAVMIYGLPGTGKSLISKLLQRLWHPKHVLWANTPEQFLGRFNAHLEYTILIACEEAVWGKSNKDSDRLKDLITGTDLMLEPKGRQMVHCRNMVRIFGTTNREFSVPAGTGERRWLVLDCLDTYADCKQEPGREEYFATLRKALHDDRVVGRFLDYALAYDYSAVNLSSAPKTVALARSQSQNLEPVAQWFFDCLASEQVMGSENNYWPKDVPCQELHGCFLEYCKNTGIRYPASLVNFGRVLKGFGLDRTRIGVRETRRYVYTFPPVRRCRELFHKKIGMQVTEAEPAWENPNKQNVIPLVNDDRKGDKGTETKKTKELF
jgi:hypothetical protein